jgi:hypothetical protein
MAKTIEGNGRAKVVVVMPAYNAAKTLRVTYEAFSSPLPQNRLKLYVRGKSESGTL